MNVLSYHQHNKCLVSQNSSALYFPPLKTDRDDTFHTSLGSPIQRPKVAPRKVQLWTRTILISFGPWTCKAGSTAMSARF